MLSHMRTTIEIGDELFRMAKQRAADDRVPLRDVVEAALRGYLTGRPRTSGYRLRWTPDRGEMLAGVDLDDRSSLHDMMDGIK
jgi:hypothetical protein